jgi:hypothetical protein
MKYEIDQLDHEQQEIENDRLRMELANAKLHLQMIVSYKMQAESTKDLVDTIFTLQKLASQGLKSNWEQQIS